MADAVNVAAMPVAMAFVFAWAVAVWAMLVPTALAVAKALVEVASKVTVIVGVLVPTVVALEANVGVMVEV